MQVCYMNFNLGGGGGGGGGGGAIAPPLDPLLHFDNAGYGTINV